MARATGPKILLFDVETAPMISYHWGLFDQNIALNQMVKDWHLLSFAAKWLGEPESKIIYADQRNVSNIENDKVLLIKLWKLLDEADIVIGQNSKKFDHKKVNARFLFHGMKPPSSYKIIDTLVMAKKSFALTSNKLEYMTNKLNTKYKKLTNRKKFSGFALWTECLAGNMSAWREMEKYNKYDVLSLEELYKKLAPWDSTVNFNLYHDKKDQVCSCGSAEFKKCGFAYTGSGKFQRYQCKSCGKESRSKKNLFTKEKVKSIRLKVT